MPSSNNNRVNENEFYNQNQGDHTYAAWFIRPTAANGPQPLIARSGLISLGFENNQIIASGADGEELASCPLPADDDRHQLVLTTTGAKATMYLDARKVAEFDQPASNANAVTTIGSNALQEKVLRLSLFNRHFSIDEVARLYRRGTGKTVLDLKTTGLALDYPTDQVAKLYGQNGATSLFANPPQPISPPEPDLPSVYPFQIKLTNQKDHSAPAIYIVSDVDRTTDLQRIDLVIENETQHRYEVASFTLSFRKGTLHEELTKNNSKGFCEKLALAIGEGATVTTTEDTASIKFEVKKPGGGKFSFEANTPRTITLSGVHAAPGTGTRTSGYEVKFEGVQEMLGSTPSGTAFSFGRNAVLQVINHQGFAHAPVHFGVMGNNFLLNNDPTAQDIAIFMQSLDGKPLAMGAETRFVFSFYANKEKENVQGELPTASEAPHVDYIGFGDRSKVTAIDLGVLPVGFQQGKDDRKEVDKFGKRDISIVPTKDIDTAFALFKFTNILLSGASGLVKVHVSVENLPGYWDSSFDVTFIKGPMVMVGNQVGIGTPIPKDNTENNEAKLLVKGDTSLEGNTTVKGATHLEGKLDVTGDTHLDGKLGIGTQPVEGNALSVKGDTNLGKLKITESIGSGNENSPLNISSDTVFQKKITVMGETHLKDNVIVDKKLTVKGNTLFTGESTLENGLTVKGDTHLEGDSILNKKLTVMGNTHLTGDLDVSGNLTLNTLPIFMFRAWADFHFEYEDYNFYHPKVKIKGRGGNIKDIITNKKDLNVAETSLKVLFINEMPTNDYAIILISNSEPQFSFFYPSEEKTKEYFVFKWEPNKNITFAIFG